VLADVADQRHLQVVLLDPLLIGSRGVDAGADDLDAQLAELVEQAVELNGFGRSATSVGFRVEPQNGAPAGRPQVEAGAVERRADDLR
jgi:hypothetical protein